MRGRAYFFTPGRADFPGGVDCLAQTAENVVQAFSAGDRLPTESVWGGEMLGDDAPELIKRGREPW